MVGHRRNIGFFDRLPGSFHDYQPMREVALEPFDFFGSRLFREELVEHPPQVLSFDGALDRLEALADQIEPAVVQLLRLAQDLLRDCDFPEIVEERRVAELADLIVRKPQVRVSSPVRPVRHLRELGGHRRHPPGVSLGGGVAVLDRLDRGVDESREEVLALQVQTVVLDGDRRLARERTNENLVVLVERKHFGLEAGRPVEDRVAGSFLVDQLEHADALPLVILHGDHQHRSRAVRDGLVESPVDGEGLAFRWRVGVLEVESFPGLGDVAGDAPGTYGEYVLLEPELPGVVLRQPEAKPAAAHPLDGALGGLDGHLEAGHQEQAPGVRVGDLPRLAQDETQEPVVIVLGGERDADGVELLELSRLLLRPGLGLFEAQLALEVVGRVSYRPQELPLIRLHREDVEEELVAFRRPAFRRHGDYRRVRASRPPGECLDGGAVLGEQVLVENQDSRRRRQSLAGSDGDRHDGIPIVSLRVGQGREPPVNTRPHPNRAHDCRLNLSWLGEERDYANRLPPPRSSRASRAD